MALIRIAFEMLVLKCTKRKGTEEVKRDHLFTHISTSDQSRESSKLTEFCLLGLYISELIWFQNMGDKVPLCF